LKKKQAVSKSWKETPTAVRVSVSKTHVYFYTYFTKHIWCILTVQLYTTIIYFYTYFTKHIWCILTVQLYTTIIYCLYLFY
jgi:hypothetical protein